MLKDWDFAQFFPNWNAAANEMSPGGTRSSEEPAEEKSTCSSSSSGGVTSATSVATPPRIMHRRNESDSALASVAKTAPADPLFGSRIPWSGRHRSVREVADDEPVSLTEFSRKASQLELRSKTASPSEFAPPRREKTDILDIRRLELKRELEERRRANGDRHSQSEVRGSSILTPSRRPPLLKSTSEPCASHSLFREQVRAGPELRLTLHRPQSKLLGSRNDFFLKLEHTPLAFF